MPTLEHGKVKFFDSRDNKRFGFIRLESGEEIFFHYNDYELLYADEGDKFNFYAGTFDHPSRTIHPEEVIYFYRGEGSSGRIKACPWTLEVDYLRALEQLAKRPRYRVFKETLVNGNRVSEPELLWEGSNLDALMLKFPLPRRNQSPGSDPLLSYASHDDFEVRRWFETQLPGGPWERCDDPRPLPGVLRQFEAINRR